MAKKRKGSARDVEEPKGPNMDVGESRKRIRTYEDVADSDDEFHLNNDKVLLEERPDVKRRRKQQEDEDFLEQSDEEVLDAPDSDDEEFESAEEGQDAVSQSGDEGALRRKLSTAPTLSRQKSRHWRRRQRPCDYRRNSYRQCRLQIMALTNPNGKPMQRRTRPRIWRQ
jgi:hypothetical protein